MKTFSVHQFDPQKCYVELQEFGQLLKKKPELNESKDVLPFFKKRLQLSALLGMMTAEIIVPNRVAHEFDVFGDFACDLAVGDINRYAYCFIEFEDAKKNSIFRDLKPRSTPEWGQRFEHGHSQIIDWLWKLDDNRQNAKFRGIFGSNQIQYIAILIIGRDSFVSDMDRLRWRSSNTIVGPTKVYSYTYDQIYNILEEKVRLYVAAASNK